MVPTTLYFVGHVGRGGGAFVVAVFGVVCENTAAKIFAASSIKNADLILA